MSATPTATRPRLFGTDALRVVALVGVVMIHATGWAPSGDPVYAAVNVISRFSVPVFMVVTGWVLGYQYATRRLGSDFIRKRASRTVIPWLVWAPVYLAFTLYVTGQVSLNAASVQAWFLEGTGHLWYLLLVPQMYVLFAVWPRRRAWIAVVPALALQTVLCVVRIYLRLPQPLETLFLVYGFELFPFWIGYFAIGVALGRSSVGGARVVRRPLLIALSAAGVAGGGYLLLNVKFTGAAYANFVAGTGAFLNPLLPLFACAIIAFVVLVASPLMGRHDRLQRPVRALSDLSLGIYIIHPMPLYGLGLLWAQSLAHGHPLGFVTLSAMAVLAIAGAAVATRLLAATPLSIVVGVRQQPIRLPRRATVSRRGAARAG